MTLFKGLIESTNKDTSIKKKFKSMSLCMTNNKKYESHFVKKACS